MGFLRSVSQPGNGTVPMTGFESLAEPISLRDKALERHVETASNIQDQRVCSPCLPCSKNFSRCVHGQASPREYSQRECIDSFTSDPVPNSIVVMTQSVPARARRAERVMYLADMYIYSHQSTSSKYRTRSQHLCASCLAALILKVRLDGNLQDRRNEGKPDPCLLLLITSFVPTPL
jgi:hypothetical protein